MNGGRFDANGAASAQNDAIRTTVRWVAALNFLYFFVEFAVALAIGSVALFADSVDFLEDASVNILIFIGLGWSARRRATLGMALAGVLLIPAIATLWTAWRNVELAAAPEGAPLTLTGLGALGVNAVCAYLLAKHARSAGSLTRVAFLSARNDVLANAAIIGAGLATAATASHWPDLIVGVGIAVLNAGAAHEVFEAARAERRAAERP